MMNPNRTQKTRQTTPFSPADGGLGNGHEAPGILPAPPPASSPSSDVRRPTSDVPSPVEISTIASSAWIEIDRGALLHNFQVIRRQLSPQTRILAVVKADGYGHGAEIVSRVLAGAGVDALGVATVGEGLALRRAGLGLPILVLGCPLSEQFETAVQANLELVISDPAQIDPLQALGARLGRRIRVHLKVDTGLGRIGVEASEAVDVAWAIRNRQVLRFAGVCSHFATADQADSEYLHYQFKVFQHVCQYIRAFAPQATAHIANSGAILNHPSTQADMVRPGLALYGAFPSPSLRPVLALKCRVVQVREVPAGRPLGYGCTYTTPAATRLAVLPVGYADGLPRALSNRQSVLIQGRHCPIVGRISMDQCLVDVDNLPVSLGEEAVLIGRQGQAAITVNEWAERCETIPYEILCGFGPRLPRVMVG